MEVTSAQYFEFDGNTISIIAEISGETIHVPLDPSNRHYQAILEWAEEDGNEIQAAE